jgi:dienelactone hydrolase
MAMNRVIAALLSATLAFACASQPAPTSSANPDASAAGGGIGTSHDAGSARGDGQGSGLSDASVPASDGATDALAHADAEAGTAADAAAQLPAPMQPAACGTDLDAYNGTLRPDFGSVPNGGVFTGTPSDAGPLTVTTTGVSVPITAATVQAANHTITITAGTLSGTAYVPAGSGPFPLVVVLPGFQTSYTSYAGFSQHFASHGFIALGVDTRSNATMASHDKEALEVKQTIDFALSAQSPFAGKVDATKIAVAGHSKGGKVAFFAAAIDPRIDVVIGWDPVNAGGGPCAFDPNCNALPVAPNCTVKDGGIEQFMHAQSLVIGAPPDPNLNPDANANAENFYRGAPAPAAYVKLAAGHIDWVEALTAHPDVILISKTVQIALLLQRFSGMTGLDDYLPDGAWLKTQSLVTAVHTK